MSGERADLALVQRGFFESRAKAQEAIAAGLVSADGRIVRKASATIAATASIVAEAPYPWVSRGGVKLAAALDAFHFDVENRVCLDIGASTGGFTQVLLERGATTVFAVDVGHGQLHRTLASNPRVVSREGTDIRSLSPDWFVDRPALITCDVSFISLKLILQPLLKLAAQTAALVALIKPQFEVGRGHLVKGIVKDETIRLRACTEIAALVEQLDFRVEAIIPSPIAGGDGNVEYLLGARTP
jgi:23S rRNA (cytidine1920-2'-O)/16S rRNA (cytidine1409-2'-O)-methyltransferase